MRYISFALILFLAILVSYPSCKKEEKKEAKKAEVEDEVKVVSEKELEPLPPEKILNPIESIKELDRKIESYKTGNNLTPEEVEANRKLKKDIIRGTFDLYELCKLALDIHWNDLKNKERNHFVDLMTNLLEKKAIFSKEQVKGESKGYRIAYNKQEFLDPEMKTSRVFTKIFIPSQKIDLDINYKLTLSPYGWKIFDVIVDEASLVENYKFQFDTIIRKHGYPELVARMEKKLGEMK